MNEGPYRGHCLTVKPKVSFAKEMQTITLEAQQKEAERLKKNTEDGYFIARKQIKLLAERGISDITVENLLHNYIQAAVKPCRQTLVSLLGRDGFNLKRIEGPVGKPTNYKVSWHCL
jgi:hypothetical protein